MARFRPEDCAIDRATDRHGIHEVAGPLLAGGVSPIGGPTGIFYDLELRHALADERRYRTHLELQERVFRLAVPVLYAAARSPVDLFRLTECDGDQFGTSVVEQIMARNTRHDGSSSLLLQRPAATHDDNDGIRDTIDDQDDGGISSAFGADKNSIMRYLPEPKIREIENHQKFLYGRCCAAQRHFAYRKLLVKLDLVQPDSDPDDVLEKLESSTRWSGLKDHPELRRCLESHMDFLREYKKSKMDKASSICEYENAALEKINSELSSALQNDLDRSDWMPMEQYYGRMQLRRLARECATQAQTIGVILVGEALPLPVSVNPEPRMLALIRRIQGKLRSGAAHRRPWQWLALGALATVATTGGFSPRLGLDSERSHSRV